MNIPFKAPFIGRKKPLLGLDIGSHTLKLVELAPGGQEVRRIGRARVPRDVIVDGAIRDPETLAARLSALLENTQPKSRRVATSISGYSVIVKRITVPYEDEREIEDNLIFEAENYVPFEIEEVYLDFHVLGPAETGKKGGTGTDIFLVAAKREVVDTYAEIIQAVGLMPAVVDVDVFALGNLFEARYEDVVEPTVLLDIGASKTNLNIVRHGLSLFSRDMAIGGDQLTQAIREGTGLALDQAEEVKIRGTDDPGLAREVRAIVKNMAKSWAQEVRKAIEFFKSGADKTEFPQALYLSGGTALMPGLDRYLEEKIGLPLRRLDPFKGLGTQGELQGDYLKEVAPQMAVGMGLAIRMEEP